MSAHDVEPPRASPRWSLGKAAFWGLSLSFVVMLLDHTWWTQTLNAPLPDFLAEVVGRLGVVPLVFVAVAAARNAFGARTGRPR